MIYDEEHKKMSDRYKNMFSDINKKTCDFYAHDICVLCRTYLKLKCLSEKQENNLEEMQERIDMTFDSVHCKYCRRNDVKVNRHFDGSKKQYKCRKCNRLFTIFSTV